MIVVDTSVWIDYFADPGRVSNLEQLLRDNVVVVHPWILGEIALGHLGSQRRAILGNLSRLPKTNVHLESEIMLFMDKLTLWGQGLSWTDIQILYTCQIGSLKLWTLDKALKRSAQKLDCTYVPG